MWRISHYDNAHQGKGEYMSKEPKEYTCNIVIDFSRSYMAEDEEEFKQMVIDDFYEEHGIKLAYSEIRNIKECQ